MTGRTNEREWKIYEEKRRYEVRVWKLLQRSDQV